MAVKAIKEYIGRVKGDDGFSPVISVAEETDISYKLSITDKTHTFDTPNLLGADGFNPDVEVYEDTSKVYRLQITDRTHSFLTPNLRGATFKSATVEVLGHEPLVIPFTDLGLNPERDYVFYAAAGIDYPYLRSINAIRVGDDAVRVSVYYDTVPYTTPRQGSPFDSGFLIIGTPGLDIGDFHIGEQLDAEPFPVNLLCFEIIE
jgi:hypothetical protein